MESVNLNEALILFQYIKNGTSGSIDRSCKVVNRSSENPIIACAPRVNNMSPKEFVDAMGKVGIDMAFQYVASHCNLNESELNDLSTYVKSKI